MKNSTPRYHRVLLASLLALAAVPSLARADTATPSAYQQTNLAADTSGAAANTDSRLVNPWGFVSGPRSVWVADNGSGLITSYRDDGTATSVAITVPAPGTGTQAGSPSGLTLNPTYSFVISKNSVQRPATLLAATEDGTIVAWNNAVTGPTGLVVVDASASGAVYKGIAIAGRSDDDDDDGALGQPPQIYVTNFHAGTVDVYDSGFKYVKSFTDSTVPAQYAPFGIRALWGKLYVTFAKQKAPDLKDDEAGPGNGFVDVFNLDGTLDHRLVSNGALNSPWGLAVAPRHFGTYGGALLVGNFGDGTINAYDRKTGALLGTLAKADGSPLVIEGLWGLNFVREHGHERALGAMARMGGASVRLLAAAHDDGARLYFTAGPGAEAHGLLGVITPVVSDTDGDGD